MATLTVEGIPPGLLRRLTSAALANGRCVNSEVILSLVRHLREEPTWKAALRVGAIDCPFLSRTRSGVPPGLNVSWGDPG